MITFQDDPPIAAAARGGRRPGRSARAWAAPGIPEAVWREMRAICARAWSAHLLAGFNGNISLRRGRRIYVTRSGAAKGDLKPGDIVKMDAGGRIAAGGRPSSETPMHLAVYAATGARAIVHTHPRHLLALSLLAAEEDFLNLPLFECAMLRKRLGFAPALNPGSPELAEAVASAARGSEAVWMWGHGLMCLGPDPGAALALSDELEHIAAVQLLHMRGLAACGPRGVIYG